MDAIIFNPIFALSGGDFTLSFESPGSEFQLELGKILATGVEAPAYEGPMTVTPTLEDQVLPTNFTLVTGNITVLAIPYTEVENEAGGLTAIIA